MEEYEEFLKKLFEEIIQETKQDEELVKMLSSFENKEGIARDTLYITGFITALVCLISEKYENESRLLNTLAGVLDTSSKYLKEMSFLSKMLKSSENESSSDYKEEK